MKDRIMKESCQTLRSFLKSKNYHLSNVKIPYDELMLNSRSIRFEHQQKSFKEPLHWPKIRCNYDYDLRKAVRRKAEFEKQDVKPLLWKQNFLIVLSFDEYGQFLTSNSVQSATRLFE